LRSAASKSATGPASAADLHRVEPGYVDGFRCISEGNLWCGAGDRVHVVSPGGDLLGKIVLPGSVQNLCFGGGHRSRLFLCASGTLFALSVNRRGAQRP